MTSKVDRIALAACLLLPLVVSILLLHFLLVLGLAA